MNILLTIILLSILKYTDGQTPGQYCQGTIVGTLYSYCSGTIKNCPAGKYQSTAKRTSCNNCRSGRYQDGTKATSCKSCTAGKYTTIYNSPNSACTNCPSGTYNTNSRQVTCTSDTRCNGGEYYTHIRTGEGTCTACPIGKWKRVTCTLNGITDTNCTHFETSCDDQDNCDLGKGNANYGNALSNGMCINCVGNTYSDVNDVSSCKVHTCGENEYVEPCPNSTGCQTALNCKSCPSGKHRALPSGVSEHSDTECTSCPSGSDFGDAGGECKTYEEKYLTEAKPTNMKSISSQITTWKTLSSKKKKRSGFLEMIKWIRTQFTNRKAKMRKEDLILSTTFKTRMGTRADVEVFNPKKDGNCDVDVNQQPDSFDITLTDVGDTGIVCKGTIKISKLELTAINDDSNTYTYYCHDGSGWGTGVSITSDGSYSCDGRKFHVN
jgi:hypothetical protein